ncbi:MAG: signal peptide peptidase SppA [Myxococcota bacterium]|jgi:protease-4
MGHLARTTGAAVAIAAALFLASSCMLDGGDFKSSKKSGPRVGVVEINETIMDSKEIVRRLDEFGEDDDLKALVLRIDTPGGAVGAVQEIYRGVMRLRGKKKIVASFGNTAASGGYYIAAAADRIFSNPGTVTGSIGVVAQVTDFSDLLALAKIKVNTIKAGRYKDMGSPTRPMTPEDEKIMQDLVSEVRGQFVSDIAKGRGMDRAKVEAAADGSIMTGAKAKELGLVDELGDMQDAVTWVAKAADLQGKPHLVYGKKKRQSLFKEMMESFIENADDVSSRFEGMKLRFQ